MTIYLDVFIWSTFGIIITYIGIFAVRQIMIKSAKNHLPKRDIKKSVKQTKSLFNTIYMGAGGIWVFIIAVMVLFHGWNIEEPHVSVGAVTKEDVRQVQPPTAQEIQQSNEQVDIDKNKQRQEQIAAQKQKAKDEFDKMLEEEVKK